LDNLREVLKPVVAELQPCSKCGSAGERQSQFGLIHDLQEHAATLERLLAAARAGEAEAQFGLIELQHAEVQQHSRCQQLEDALAEADCIVQKLQSDLQQLQTTFRSSSHVDDASKDRMASDLQIQCMMLRADLQTSQLSSLRATRDSLLQKKLAVGGCTSSLAEAQLPPLLEYVQDMEKLLDSYMPQVSDQTSEFDCIEELHKQTNLRHGWKGFLDDPSPANLELKPCLTTSRLKRHSARDDISTASTSVGSSSSPSRGFPEDLSPIIFLGNSEKAAILLSAPDKVDTVKRVTFKPTLRMQLPDADYRRRRSSAKFKTKPGVEQRANDSTWSMPDFTEWYG
jgi:hypothetical protein